MPTLHSIFKGSCWLKHYPSSPSKQWQPPFHFTLLLQALINLSMRVHNSTSSLRDKLKCPAFVQFNKCLSFSLDSKVSLLPPRNPAIMTSFISLCTRRTNHYSSCGAHCNCWNFRTPSSNCIHNTASLITSSVSSNRINWWSFSCRHFDRILFILVHRWWHHDIIGKVHSRAIPVSCKERRVFSTGSQDSPPGSLE
jgi:hypothetical protein